MVATLTTLAPGAQAQEAGPAWCPEPEARQFDFWLGEWDVRNRNRPPGGDRWYDTGVATNRVYAVVGGCAVVEHWRGYAFPSAGHIAGFSVRTWDPEASEWDLVLLWPVGGPPRFGNPRGRFRDGRGEFTNSFAGPSGDTVISRLTFSDITEGSFRWSNGLSDDGGRSWSSTWTMDQTRRSRGASGLWNGATPSTRRCPGAEHRTFDPFLGEWEGTRVSAAGDSTRVRMRMLRILDGCAVMQRSVVGAGEGEAFRVRAYEPHLERWTEYATASDRRGLRRREGGPEGGEIVIEDVESAGEGWTRTRWRPADEALVQIRESAADPRGPWTEVDRTRYTPVPRDPAGGR